MEAFLRYKDHFDNQANTINRKIGKIPDLVGEARKEAIREVDKLIIDAEGYISEMDLMKGRIPAQAARCDKIIRDSWALITKMKRELARATTESPAYQRSPWESDTKSDAGSMYSETLKMREESSARLNNALRYGKQSEEIGEATLDELYTQRETLVRAKSTLDDIDSNMSRSRRIVLTMQRRVATNKLILVLIIIILMASIAIIIYFRWGRKKHHSSSGSSSPSPSSTTGETTTGGGTTG